MKKYKKPLFSKKSQEESSQSQNLLFTKQELETEKTKSTVNKEN